MGVICRTGIAYRPAYPKQKEPELKPLVCKCCGGKVDRATMTCYYCDTEYIEESKAKNLYEVGKSAVDGIQAGIMTPNEARKTMGLGAIHAYDTAGRIVKSFEDSLYVTLSQAEYDALGDEKYSNGVTYYIED